MSLELMADIGAEPVTIDELYSRNNKLFRIPQYQRSYAWEKKQREDLWNDLEEGMINDTENYLGTIILQETGEVEVDEVGDKYFEYEVVDGQQRLTSLSLLILSICENLGRGELYQHLRERFIGNGDGVVKLTLGLNNNKYFKKIERAIENDDPIPAAESITNKRIEKSFNFFRDKLSVKPPEDLMEISMYIRNEMKILELVTEDKTLAIKTFQTVNDRGKDLTLLDKTKSFLMFYLTKYLPEDRDTIEEIEENFGEVFKAYDQVKELGVKYNISYLTQKRQKFSEDNFLQYFYHNYVKYAKRKYELESVEYEYNISAENVFQHFIKNACREVKSDPESLKEFIKETVYEMKKVSMSLQIILEKINKNYQMEKLMRWQQPNAFMYPLLINLEAENMLDQEMIELIKVLDMRIYKIRNTDPRARLYRKAVAEVKNKSMDEIKQVIQQFVGRWGSNEELDSHLRGSIYSRGNRGEKIALWEYAKSEFSEEDARSYELYRGLELEHILAVESEAELDLRTCGFEDEEEFNAFEDRFGNLALLESDLNKKARNKPPVVKAADVYAESEIRATRILGNKIQDKGVFSKSDIEERTNEIIKSVKEEWKIPDL